VINACHGADIAKLLSSDEHSVPYVMSWETVVDDQAAQTFSEVFYEALASGCGYPEAYDQATAFLKMRSWVIDREDGGIPQSRESHERLLACQQREKDPKLMAAGIPRLYDLRKGRAEAAQLCIERLEDKVSKGFERLDEGVARVENTLTELVDLNESTLKMLRELEQKIDASTAAVLKGMLELKDELQDMPYYFLLVPKGKMGQYRQSDPGFWRTWLEQLSLFQTSYVIFPCQSSETAHTTAEGYLNCVHKPIEVKVPGEMLKKAAPILQQINNLIKIASVVGKVAGFPLPPGLPFLESLQKVDQIQFLEMITDDAARVDSNGKVDQTDENQQAAFVAEAVDVAGGAAQIGSNKAWGVEEVKQSLEAASDERTREQTVTAYGQLKEILKDHDIKCESGLQLMRVKDVKAVQGPIFRWVCASCAAKADQLLPELVRP
jgi:hypothetical protein